MDQKLVRGEKENLKCNNTKVRIEFQIIYSGNHNVRHTIKWCYMIYA